MKIIPIKRLISCIPSKKDRRRFWVISLLSAFSGTLDIIGVASLLPVLFITIEKDAITKYAIVNKVYQLLGFSNRTNFIFFVIGCFFLIILIKNIVGLLISYIQYHYSYRVSRNITASIFSDYFSKGFLFMTGSDHATLWRDLMVNPYTFGTSILLPVFMMVAELWVITLIIAGIAYYDYKVLILVFFSIVPFSVLFYLRIRNKLFNLGDERNRLYPETNKILLDTLNGFSTILIMAKQSFFRRNYLSKRKILDKNEIDTAIVNLLPFRVIEVITMMSILIVLVFFISTNASTAHIITALGVFGASAYRLLPSINRIISSMMKMKNSSFVFAVLSQFDLSVKEQTNQDSEHAVPVSFKKEIKLQEISFKYPGKEMDILKQVSITVPKGSCIGIVGESGAGKSTLINLLLRFISEREGFLAVDGVRIKEENENGWRSLLGYVPQDVFVMDDTLINNIAFGAENSAIDLQRVEQSIDKAKLSTYVKDLPDGVQTTMGELGNRISGGQKQRIGIARALYQHAEIFIFDEITSSLDSQTEQKILESIKDLIDQKKTIIIVAHRTSTLKYCDTIFELREGEISNTCSYRELLETKKNR